MLETILRPYNAFLRFVVSRGIPKWIWTPLWWIIGGGIAVEIGKRHYHGKKGS